MTAGQVFLPWPDKGLSPNARLHYMVVAKLKKAYRQACWALACSAGLKGLLPANSKPLVSVTFCPPDLRARDRDNMLASIKAGLDGLADALGCDDSRWRLLIKVSDPVKLGLVKIKVSL